MSNKDSKSEPKELTLDDKLAHIFAVELQNEIKLDKLLRQLEYANNRIDKLQKAVSRTTFVKTHWISLRYDFKTSELILGGEYRMDFSNTIESDLLAKLFTESTSKPKKSVLYFPELAIDFEEEGNEKLSDAREIYKVAHRIRDRIRNKTGADLLIVRKKELFWYSPH